MKCFGMTFSCMDALEKLKGTRRAEIDFEHGFLNQSYQKWVRMAGHEGFILIHTADGYRTLRPA